MIYGSRRSFRVIIEISEGKFEINKSIRIVQTGKLNDDKKPQWLALAVVNLLSQGLNIQLKYVAVFDHFTLCDL